MNYDDGQNAYLNNSIKLTEKILIPRKSNKINTPFKEGDEFALVFHGHCFLKCVTSRYRL